jgi:hypothetical protein
MGYKDLISYSSIIDIPYSSPTYEETRQRLLNLRSGFTEANMLCAFFLLYVIINERKKSKTPNTSYLMFEARLANLKEIPKSSSIKKSKRRSHINFLFGFKTHTDCRTRTLDNNQ